MVKLVRRRGNILTGNLRGNLSLIFPLPETKRSERAEGNQRSSALAAGIFGGPLRHALPYIKTRRPDEHGLNGRPEELVIRHQTVW